MTHLFDADAAIAAVGSGTIDASFRAVTKTAQQLPDGIEVRRVLDDPSSSSPDQPTSWPPSAR